jgi:hypothetical protein
MTNNCIEQLHFADTNGTRIGWLVLAKVRICWLDSKFAMSILSVIAATISFLLLNGLARYLVFRTAFEAVRFRPSPPSSDRAVTQE